MKKTSLKNLAPYISFPAVIILLTAVVVYTVSLKPTVSSASTASAPLQQRNVIIQNTEVPNTPSPVPSIAPVLIKDSSTDNSSDTDLNAPFWSEGSILFENTYKSPTLSVAVTTHNDSKLFNKRLVYYVADIHVADPTQIRTAAASENFAKAGSGQVLKMARRENALLAVSGDYCGYHKSNLIIRNGEIYREKIGSGDICILYKSGEMETIRSSDASIDSILEKEPWQAWQFGPGLLESDGTPRKSFSNSRVSPNNPRCCIGYFEPGHYCFVLVDGRQKASSGLSLKELAALMHQLGCKQAYNLDGGASAHMYGQDRIFNRPSGGGRKISDIIYIAKESYASARFFYGKAGISE